MDMPNSLKNMVDAELESGEKIVWLDMPRPSYFTPAAIGAFLFGIPWTAFSIFWMFGASGFKVPEFNDGLSLFPLFGVPFVLIGIGLLSSPLWAYRKALKTVYVITNRRAITFEGGRMTTIHSYPPEKLRDIHRKEKADGSGDVIIAQHSWTDSDGGKRTEALGFMRIKDVKKVERMLKSLAENGAQPDVFDAR